MGSVGKFVGQEHSADGHLHCLLNCWISPDWFVFLTEGWLSAKTLWPR